MKRDRSNLTQAWWVAGLCLALASASGAPAPEAPKGLVLHLGFDKPDTGGVVADKSGANNNGRVVEAKWAAQARVGGGCALSPGTMIRVPSNTAIGPRQGTFAAWIKAPRADGATRLVLGKGKTRGYSLSIAGDTPDPKARGKLVATINARYHCLSDDVVADGAWRHVAATCDGKELRLYIDGRLQGQPIPCPEEIAGNSDDLTIGLDKPRSAGQDKIQGFVGWVDEVMIYNRALSEEEVKTVIAAANASGPGGRPTFTKQQVAGRLRQLKLLYEEGLLTDGFYEERVRECEGAQ